MNKRQIEALKAQAESEEWVLKELEKQYRQALEDIDERIAMLQAGEMTQSRIYQAAYQKTLRKQVQAIVDKLHADTYTTLEQFFTDTYQAGYVGTMYDVIGQAHAPVISPIDQAAVTRAVMTDSQISKSLYDTLGIDAKQLKKTISREISRGIATGISYDDMARNIETASQAPLRRAKTIARTEAHRIYEASSEDARQQARAAGAQVMKQWDATLDGKTRDNHRQLDGTVVEADGYFTIDGKKAKYPGAFGDAAEDCNCRCVALTRAKWALDQEELGTLQQRAAFFKLDKTNNLKDFTEKYLKAQKAIQTGGHIDFTDAAARYEKRTQRAADIYQQITETDDIGAIAKASGMPKNDIKVIKQHIFFDTHQLYDGKGKFAPDYDMAIAWQRLAAGKPEARDILLLKHELLESQVEKEYHLSAAEAHAIASKKYDWAAELFEALGEEGESDDFLQAERKARG